MRSPLPGSHSVAGFTALLVALGSIAGCAGAAPRASGSPSPSPSASAKPSAFTVTAEKAAAAMRAGAHAGPGSPTAAGAATDNSQTVYFCGPTPDAADVSSFGLRMISLYWPAGKKRRFEISVFIGRPGGPAPGAVVAGLRKACRPEGKDFVNEYTNAVAEVEVDGWQGLSNREVSHSELAASGPYAFGSQFRVLARGDVLVQIQVQAASAKGSDLDRAGRDADAVAAAVVAAMNGA